jgi:hypothetical protein
MPEFVFTGPYASHYPEARDAAGLPVSDVEPGDVRDLDGPLDQWWQPAGAGSQQDGGQQPDGGEPAGGGAQQEEPAPPGPSPDPGVPQPAPPAVPPAASPFAVTTP